MLREHIERLALQVSKCEKCDLALKRERAIPGEGPLDAEIFLVGQAPFDSEQKNGRPFWGVTGSFLRYFLGRAEVNFYDCWRTNLLKCPLPRYGRPKWRQVNACLPYLEEELKLIGPKIIVPLGKWATKGLLSLFGIPRPEKNSMIPEMFGEALYAGNYIIFPLPHPASLVYRSSLWDPTVSLFELLGSFLSSLRKGELDE